MEKNLVITAEQKEKLIDILKKRFEKHKNRNSKLEWTKIQEKLEFQEKKLWSLYQMEETGGEPDVVDYDKKNNTYIFMDCSAESPRERRSLCYDQQALESRKEHRPADSAVAMAERMQIELMTEEQYRHLQTLGNFDLKTSSWVKTPLQIRELGGALFCDRRYNSVFVYHNGASSYYAARGFRGVLKV